MAKPEKTTRHYPLNQIYFYLTKECNLKCRHCWLSPKYQNDKNVQSAITPELFESILHQAKPLGLSGVKFTGGEPFLHPQLTKLIDIVIEEDIGLTIETNGTLISSEIAEKITHAKNHFISVSLDAADGATHEWIRGVKGCFKKTIKGIKTLVHAGVKPQIIMSVMECNKDQLPQLIELAETLGASSVKFNLVQPTARGESLHKSNQVPGIEKLVELGKWVENELSKSTSMRLIFHHPPAFKPLSKMFGENSSGCGICGIRGILGVLSDGSYALCGIGENVPELIFGHSQTDSLENVWNQNGRLCELREDLPGKLEGICGRCLLKELCKGSCIAQNYYRNKSLWAPFWFCEKAEQKALFPETRMLPGCA